MVICGYFIHWFPHSSFCAALLSTEYLYSSTKDESNAQHYMRRCVTCCVYVNIKDHNIFILFGMATLDPDQVLLTIFDIPHYCIIIQVQKRLIFYLSAKALNP